MKQKAQKTLVASVRLSRASGNDRVESKPFHLTIQDESSRVEFVSIYMSCEAFANMMSLRNAEGDMEVRHLDLVGTIGENKTERVPFNNDYSRDENSPAVRKALKPFEVDGWKGCAKDLFNGHRHNQDGTYNVTFFRHVRHDGTPVT